MIEPKSLTPYLNGYAQTRQVDAETVVSRIVDDLSACCGADVGVELWEGGAVESFAGGWLSGESIDDLEIDVSMHDEPQPHLLGDLPCNESDAGWHAGVERTTPADRARSVIDSDDIEDDVEEALVSRLFRSNCPVTGQPDWADVQVRYRGPAIDHAALLGYLLSYRAHCGFHEQCVERIFLDIKARCRPAALTVYARFTRRGGLDINPWRSDDATFVPPDNAPTIRQ